MNRKREVQFTDQPGRLISQPWTFLAAVLEELDVLEYEIKFLEPKATIAIREIQITPLHSIFKKI